MSAEAGPTRHTVRWLRNVFGSVSARSWEWMFRLLTRPNDAPPTRPLAPTDHGRVLVIAPHPDDEAGGCGGALIHHHRAGNPVTVACVTDGALSTAINGTAEARADQRRSELEKAAGILGIDSVRWMAFPEGRWQADRGATAIAELIESLRPALIYGPSRIDFHPEHHLVARALAHALREVSCEPVIRVYPVLVPLCRPLANLEIDVTEVSNEIERALRAHGSQWGTLERTIRRRRYSAVVHRVDGLVEEFWELGATPYSKLHLEPPHDDERFHGLRYDPWTDPLAYLVGRSARRRIFVEAEAAAATRAI